MVTNTAEGNRFNSVNLVPTKSNMSRCELRVLRNMKQSQLVAEKNRKAWKDLPKAYREKVIKQARDKRNVILQSGMTGVSKTILNRFRMGPKMSYRYSKNKDLQETIMAVNKSVIRIFQAVKASEGMFSNFTHDIANFVQQSGITDACAVGGLIVGTCVAKGLMDTKAKADRTLDYANGFAAFTDEIKSKVTKFVQFIQTKCGILFPIVLAFIVIHILKMLDVPGKFVKTICFLFGPFFPKEYEPALIEVQSGLEDTKFSSVPFLLNIVTIFCGLGGDLKKWTGEIGKRVSFSEKTTSGFAHIIENALDLFEKCANIFLRKLGKQEISLLHTIDKDMKEWDLACTNMIDILRSGKPTMAELQVAAQILHTGQFNRTQFCTKENARWFERKLDALTSALQPHMGATDIKANFRPKPTCLMLGGGSGVGKTSMVAIVSLISLVLSGTLDDERKAMTNTMLSKLMVDALDCEKPEGLSMGKIALLNTWQKGCSQYWNGYIGQKCYVMDDCFQIKPKSGEPDCEPMEIIRQGSSWACPLNMADLAGKGKFYFTSPLIIGTTNCKNIQSLCADVLTCPEAVTRRITHGYWIYVKPEWKKHGTQYLDYTKMRKAFESKLRIQAARAKASEKIEIDDIMSCFPWEAWHCIPHDFAREAPNEDVRCEPALNLKDVVISVADSIRSTREGHECEVSDNLLMADLLADVMSAFEEQSGIRSYITDCAHDDEYEEILYMPLAEPVMRQRNAFVERLKMIFWALPNYLETLAWNMGNFLPTVIFDSFKGSYYQTTSQFMDEVVAAGSPDDWFYEHEGEIFFDGIPHDGPLAYIFAAMKLFTVYKMLKFMLFLIEEVCKFIMYLVEQIVRVIGTVITFPFRKKRVQKQSNIKETIKKSQRVEIDRPILQSSFTVEPPPTNSIYYNNSMKMIFRPTMDSNFQSVGQILFVTQRVAIMPHHFRRDLEANINGYVEFVNLSFAPASVLAYSVSDFLAFPHHVVKSSANEYVDMEYVKFPSSAQPAGIKPIDKRIPKREQLGRIFGARSPIIMQLDRARNKVSEHDGETCYKVHKYISGARVLTSNFCEKELLPLSNGRDFMHNIFSYIPSEETLKGDCGAPICTSSGDLWGNQNLFGIHVGKLGNKGIASYFCKEDVDEAIKLLDNLSDNFFDDLSNRGINLRAPTEVEVQSAVDSGLIGGSIVPIGIVDKGLNMATVSNIQKSTAFGIFGDAPSRPAILHPVVVGEEKIFPMSKAMEAYQSPMEYKKLDKMPVVLSMATQKHFEATKDATRAIFTFEEAVEGKQGLKIKSIARNTSCGYPYRLDHANGKKEFFGFDDEFVYDSQPCVDLRVRVNQIIESAKKGVRLSHIFADFLKDELRPHAKVDAVATRAISSAPLDYVVAVRMYFGAMLAAFFDSNVHSGMAPGINHYTDWWKLARNLLQPGGKVFAGDFKRFDASEQPYIHNEILRYVNIWYKLNNKEWKPEDDLIREVLWMDLTNSRHLTGLSNNLNLVTEWNKSLPSGHPLTTFVNSFYSLITLTYCYVHLTGDHRDMWKHAYICTFGDDNVVGVDDQTATIFNQRTVSNAMMELFSLTYTSDKKDAELIETETINDITFLKRRFVKAVDVPGGWIAPLEPDSFKYMVYWNRNKRDPIGDTHNNVELTLGELSLHDQSFWDELYPELARWCIEHGRVPQYIDREAARQSTLSRTEVWN